MKSSLLLAAFIFPLLLVHQRDDDFIKWQEDRKLTWEDFKAEPVKMGSTAAMTTTHLGFGYSVMNGQVNYKIDCRFEKKKSWGLVKNEWILNHEQGHFDIAEVHARILNKKMAAYKFNRNTYKNDLRKIYEEVISEKELMQNKYDEETNHSIEKDKQAEWLLKIKALLKDTESYKYY